MEKINYSDVLRVSKQYKKDMSTFLRDMIALPSESSCEKEVVQRIKKEMDKVGFDEVYIDKMGNVIGRIGNGNTVIAMDAHIDTVGVGDITLWNYDPYKGFEDDQIIIGRGASDQEGGMASMVYAGKIMKDLYLLDDFTLLITGTVQEEDCDGLCWQHIIEKEGIKPEFVVITEPTNCNIYIGQRGRMEIKVTTKGVSCHGSAPERGENAIFKMAPILTELKQLNERLHVDDFLGKGTLTVSEIFFTSPSRCAVADSCSVSIDRRLTWGETWNDAMEEIRALPSVQKAQASVEIFEYDKPSYTDNVFKTKCYFPAWKINKEHDSTKALINGYRYLFNEEPLVDKWTFSTNGVSIMGRYGIPCIGFGPGKEEEAHAPNEKTWKDHLVKCAAMYSIIPLEYLKIKNNRDK